MNNKAAAQTWWIIIAAVIAILVMIVVIMIFNDQSSRGRSSLMDCQSKGGICEPSDGDECSEVCDKLDRSNSAIFNCPDSTHCCCLGTVDKGSAGAECTEHDDCLSNNCNIQTEQLEGTCA